jgi:nicotine blue oxidoreductase
MAIYGQVGRTASSSRAVTTDRDEQLNAQLLWGYGREKLNSYYRCPTRSRCWNSFGQGPQALLMFHGRPLVEVLAHVLLAGGCHEVAVVVGSGAQHVSTVANLHPFNTVVNHGWRSGMGSSYLAGCAAASRDNHLLIALVDQPGLTSGTVARLLASHKPGRITAAAYGTVERSGLQRGHPLLIDVALRGKVRSTVAGDAGARRFLQAHPELIDEVECGDFSMGADIDTPGQLHLLR